MGRVEGRRRGWPRRTRRDGRRKDTRARRREIQDDEEEGMEGKKAALKACLLATVACGTLGVLLASVWMLIRNQDLGSVQLVAGAFVLLCVLMAAYQVSEHYAGYVQPELQRYVIRILLMVPIYAVDSFFMLLHPESARYLDAIRMFYEAFALQSFVWFLLAYLQQQARQNFTTYEEILEAKGGTQEHLWPFYWMLRPWTMGAGFLRKVKRGVMNYVIIRPITTLLAFLLQSVGKLHEGNLSPAYAYFWLSATNGVSQLWALYCLVILYKASREDLAGIKPFLKFACIKSVIFLTYWQGIAVAALVELGFIAAWFGVEEGDSVEKLTTRLQSFIICVEMFFAAIVHCFAFGAEEYRDEMDPIPTRTMAENLKALVDFSDVHQDFMEQVQDHGKKLDKVKGRVVKTAMRPIRALRRMGQVEMFFAGDGQHYDDEHMSLQEGEEEFPIPSRPPSAHPLRRLSGSGSS